MSALPTVHSNTSVIAFRAGHAIIDLTGFRDMPNIHVPGITNTIQNLLSKNILPVLKVWYDNVIQFMPIVCSGTTIHFIYTKDQVNMHIGYIAYDVVTLEEQPK